MISNVMQAELTSAITFLKGEYALWKYQIPYYSTVLPMKFVAEKFRLVDEIQGSETIEWSIDELFQRDIAWERIDKQLIKYLKNENRPQFFNALTIALLPVTSTGLADTYKEDQIYNKIDDPSLDEPIQIGGVQIQSYKGSNDTAGQLRWDVNKIIAVAVDGQHRLAAMKKLYEQIDVDKMSKSMVPVIFLLPDTRAGYVEPAQPEAENSVIASLRRVFIDLNKNSKPVSRARNILLDDLDIASVCVRTLIGERLSSKPEPNRLPLAVIDWVSEKNKFETGPFITTILTLHDLITEILGDSSLEPVSEDDINIKKWFIDKFSVSDEELEDLMDRVKRCYYQEIPLTFQPAEILILKNRFKEKWAPFIVKILKELDPYKRVISYGIENDLHRPEFVNLYIAEEVIRGDYGADKAAKIKANLKVHDETWKYEDRYLAHINKINDELKDGLWAFKVVFQKALFYSYANLLQQADEFLDEDVSHDKTIEEFTNVWIEAINALFSAGLGIVTVKASGNDYLWAGIGLGADGNIEYTKIAAKRISDWLNVWVSMYWMEEIPTYKQLTTTNYDGGIFDICKNSINKTGIKKIVRARDEEGLDQEAFEAEAERQTDLRYSKFRKELNR